MTSIHPPSVWQDVLRNRLAYALTQSRFAHAPLADGGMPAATRWRLPARAVQVSDAAAQALAEMLGTGTAAQHRELTKRCLQQYRQMAADGGQDDLGRVLAAYLGACRQAFDQEALSTQRWQAITQWLQAWVIDEMPWDDEPLGERQDAFERFATLAVALGEWTVQASRQGTAELGSATRMARDSLSKQLGLDLPALCAVLKGLDVVPTVKELRATLAPTAAN